MAHAITIVEVGPRDGFQSIKPWIATEDKIAVVGGLLDAGLPLMEAASFISPKAIAQMRDAAEVMAAFLPAQAGRLYALAANRRGAAQAVASGVKKLTMVVSASPDHNKSNVNKTPGESLEELRQIRADFPELEVKLDLATAFGCPFRGAVGMEEIFFVLDGAAELGLRDVCLCDTIGVAIPTQVKTLLGEVERRYSGGGIRWSVHFHNTRGMALANTLSALELGVTTFETAVAGLGGCPFAPGASGNMATEDLVYLLDEMGLSCGVDLSKILGVSETLTGRLGLCRDSKIDAVTRHKIFPKY